MREAVGVCPDSHGPLSEVMKEGDNFGRMMGTVIEKVKALGLNVRRSNQLSVWRARAGCVSIRCVYMQMTSGCVYIYERSHYQSVSCTAISQVRKPQHAARYVEPNALLRNHSLGGKTDEKT